MTVYAIAELTITDRAEYAKYLEGFMEVFSRYNGAVLASDESVQVLEGSWDKDKFVLLSFPDDESFAKWALSPEYQELAKHRHRSSHGYALLVKGVDSL